VGLEGYQYDHDDSNDNNMRTIFEVYTYSNPAAALSNFKPNFYDLMLTDILMPI
jgi:YesN/AraC family two-component response regulator